MEYREGLARRKAMLLEQVRLIDNLLAEDVFCPRQEVALPTGRAVQRTRRTNTGGAVGNELVEQVAAFVALQPAPVTARWVFENFRPQKSESAIGRALERATTNLLALDRAPEGRSYVYSRRAA